MGKQTKKKFFGMKNPFELQDEFDETNCIEYYSGIDGRTIDRVTCPEHVWEVLDNMHSMLCVEYNITNKERDFMLNMLSKLMDKVEPCCRELLM